MRKMQSLTAMLAVLALLPASPAAAQLSDGYQFLQAVTKGDAYKAKTFLDKPGSTVVNSRDITSGETALMIVTRRKDPSWLVFLLQNGADPNQRDKDGNTALLLAASGNFSDGVQLMLNGKAQVDLANNRGETALIRAVHARDQQAVQALLLAGADPDRPDSLAGLSARDYAARDSRAGQIGKMLAEAPRKAAKAQVGPRL